MCRLVAVLVDPFAVDEIPIDLVVDFVLRAVRDEEAVFEVEFDCFSPLAIVKPLSWLNKALITQISHEANHAILQGN